MATKERREECRRAREQFVRKHYWALRKIFREELSRWSDPHKRMLRHARRKGCCGKTVCDVDLSISLENEFGRQQEEKRGQRKS